MSRIWTISILICLAGCARTDKSTIPAQIPLPATLPVVSTTLPASQPSTTPASDPVKILNQDNELLRDQKAHLEALLKAQSTQLSQMAEQHKQMSQQIELLTAQIDELHHPKPATQPTQFGERPEDLRIQLELSKTAQARQQQQIEQLKQQIQTMQEAINKNAQLQGIDPK